MTPEPSPDFALETERLILRAWRDNDLAPFHAMCNDPQVMEHLGPPMSEVAVLAGIARQRNFQETLGRCFWAIERRDDGAFLGFCGLKPGPEGTPLEHRTEIGWRLRADAWGRGYAREAAQASLDWGWANLPDPEIRAITVIGNSRSWGLMERLGMSRRHDLDFVHPAIPADSPLRHCITYSIERPA